MQENKYELPRIYLLLKKKLRGLSPRANYTERAAAAGRRSECQLLWIEGCLVVSATDPPRPLISVFWTGAATFFIQVAPQLTSGG